MSKDSWGERNPHPVPAGFGSYNKPSYSKRNRIARATWQVVYTLLFLTTPRPLHKWRVFLLSIFGAKLGRGCCIYPTAKIWAPWNLSCGDSVAVGDGANIYNPARVTLDSHCIISEGAFLCAATHDPNDFNFRLYSKPIFVGSYAWVGARSNILPGVTVGQGAVLGLGSTATKDLQPWCIYVGSPARMISRRTLPTQVEQADG